METGRITLFSNAIELYDGLALKHTNSELRYEIEKPGKRYNLFISMEFLEHINDVSSDNIGLISTWLYSGLKNYLSEVKRVLKLGGVFIFNHAHRVLYDTCPNILNNVSPFSLPKHIRYCCLGRTTPSEKYSADFS